MSENFREPFGPARYYGIVCVESDDPSPLVMFSGENDADAELATRQALPDDDDRWLSQDYVVLPYDIVGAMWNSFDPDPRADNPLDIREICAAHEVHAS